MPNPLSKDDTIRDRLFLAAQRGLTAWRPGKGPCLAWMFHRPLPMAAGEIGIIGPTAGVIASLQSKEAIKRLIGKGETIQGNWN
jgi:molybdopterin/thiamine biosynthesis adenylyltransferase